MIKFFKMFFVGFLILFLIFAALVFYYFYMGKPPVAENIIWGVDFSQSHAEYLNLDWKETFLAIINDLGVKNIKLHTNWNWVEIKKDNFYFEDIDWQIKKAEENNVKIIYVFGLKTGRWPECHIPEWAKNITKEQQRQAVLKYVKEVVLRYKDSKAIAYWQVENEPLFRFGECPEWYYKNDNFLKEEIELVKQLDPSRQVIISDSGEQSSWLKVAQIGDIVGITMYRKAWMHITNKLGFNIDFLLLNPTTYFKKSELVKKMSGKKVICIELQAEPWFSKPLMETNLSSQLKSMDINSFKKNIEFAKSTGLDTFYFWGVEWWYQMKTQKNHPEFWEEAKILFN